MAASHYLPQCWHIVSWMVAKKIQWNVNEKNHTFRSRICIYAFENVVCKISALSPAVQAPIWHKLILASLAAIAPSCPPHILHSIPGRHLVEHQGLPDSHILTHTQPGQPHASHTKVLSNQGIYNVMGISDMHMLPQCTCKFYEDVLLFFFFFFF